MSAKNFTVLLEKKEKAEKCTQKALLSGWKKKSVPEEALAKKMPGSGKLKKKIL